jgi:hypothetical protein
MGSGQQLVGPAHGYKASQTHAASESLQLVTKICGELDGLAGGIQELELDGVGQALDHQQETN